MGEGAHELVLEPRRTLCLRARRALARQQLRALLVHPLLIVDVGAAGVSFPDLLLMRGEYQLRLDPPFVPGMEVAVVVRPETIYR